MTEEGAEAQNTPEQTTPDVSAQLSGFPVDVFNHLIDLAKHTKDRIAYTLWIGVWVLVGYLLATVPPQVLDPKLTTHVAFGARTYPCFPLIYPVGTALFLATLIIMVCIPKHRFALIAVPMLAATFGSLFIFRPEMPHSNIVFVMTVWIAITVATVWIHDERVQEQDERTACVYSDYLKEQTQFWRTVTWALLASILALVVASVKEAHTSNESFLTDRGQIFMANVYSTLQLSLFCLYSLVGPIYESARKTRKTVEMMLNAK